MTRIKSRTAAAILITAFVVASTSGALAVAYLEADETECQILGEAVTESGPITVYDCEAQSEARRVTKVDDYD